MAGCVTFETDDGHVIGQRLLAPVEQQMTFPPGTARAELGGGRIDHDHLMFGLTQYLPTPEAGRVRRTKDRTALCRLPLVSRANRYRAGRRGAAAGAR